MLIVMSTQADNPILGPDSSEPAPRVRSTIKFPYGDLDDAVAVARAIHNGYGTSCTLDQLAGSLGQTTTSGSFRLKVAAAQIFDVVTAARGQLTLTQTGLDLVDSQKEAVARAKAFLQVPLYGKLHEKFRGNRLPAEKGLEQEMIQLGVSAKQADKARHSFNRSARQAGFFQSGDDRLVQPSTLNIPPSDGNAFSNASAETPPPPPLGLSLRADLLAEPLIVGLFNALPPLDADARSKLDEWIGAAKAVFGLVYKTGSTPSRDSASDPSGHGLP